MKPLVDLWDEQLDRGDYTLPYEGKLLYREIYLSVKEVSYLRIEFVDYKMEPSQILGVDLSPGTVSANGVEAKKFNLYAETAPKTAVLKIKPMRNQEKLVILNKWVYGGVIDGLIGNFGIVVVEREDYLELQCSDGVGEPDFSSLVVRVSVGASTAGPWRCPLWTNRSPQHF